MSHIALASASTDLRGRIQEATEGAEVLSLLTGPLPATPARLVEHLGEAGVPDVVVLDTALSGTEQAIGLAARFEEAPTDDPASRGRIIGVVSAKGGVGKTTVATNLAVGLTRSGENSTVLVDLDLQLGDAASALNLDPEFTLPDAVRGPATRDTTALKTFLTQHETGLFVLCGPPTPAAADAVTAEDVAHLLRMLASEFRYVVVDTAPGLSEHTLSVMDQTTDLVLVTSMDVPGVRGLRKELDTLAALDMSTATRHVIVNFADTRAGLSRADVEANLGTAIDLMLPRSKGAVASVNQGIPLLQSETRDPVTRRLRELVGRFCAPAPRLAEAKRRTGRARGRHRAPGRAGR